MRNYVTPSKSHSVPFDAQGVWNATVIRVDAATNQAWLRVPRMTGDVDRGPVKMPVLPVPLKAGDEVMVGFQEGRQESLAILSHMTPPDDPGGWLNINLPSNPSDSLFSSWDLSGNAAIVDNIFWIEDGQSSESSLGNLNIKDNSGAYSFGDGISCFVTPAPHLVDLVLKYRVSSTSVWSLESGFWYPNWRMYLRGPDHEDELLPNGSFFQFEATSEVPSEDVFIEWLKAEDLLASRHNLMSSAQSYLSHRYGGQACASHRITPSVFEDASYVDADDTCPFGRYIADGQGSETLYQVERTVRFQMVVPGGANAYSFPDAETPYEDDSELFLVISSEQYAQVEIDLDVTTLRVKPL